jgi:hypothetical protein
VTEAKAAALHAATTAATAVTAVATTAAIAEETTATTVVVTAAETTEAETATKAETSVVATPSHVLHRLRLRALTARTTTTICRSDPQSLKIDEGRLERVVFFFGPIARLAERLFADVQDVTKGGSEDLKGEDQGGEGHAGDEGKVGLAGEEVGVVVADHAAPGGHGGLGSEAEKGEARLEEDGAGELAGGQDDEGGYGLGHDVLPEDAAVGVAKDTGGLDEFGGLPGDDLAPNESGDLYPRGESNSDEDLPKSFAEDKAEGHDHE